MNTKGIQNTPSLAGVASTDATRKQDLRRSENDARNDASSNRITGAKVAVSERARDLAEARAKAFEIAQNAPDVREDKVAALKAKIADGSYMLSAENIADGIISETFKDEAAIRLHDAEKR